VKEGLKNQGTDIIHSLKKVIDSKK
jgi:hypothetical protein